MKPKLLHKHEPEHHRWSSVMPQDEFHANRLKSDGYQEQGPPPLRKAEDVARSADASSQALDVHPSTSEPSAAEAVAPRTKPGRKPKTSSVN